MGVKETPPAPQSRTRPREQWGMGPVLLRLWTRAKRQQGCPLPLPRRVSHLENSGLGSPTASVGWKKPTWKPSEVSGWSWLLGLIYPKALLHLPDCQGSLVPNEWRGKGLTELTASKQIEVLWRLKFLQFWMKSKEKATEP